MCDARHNQQSTVVEYFEPFQAWCLSATTLNTKEFYVLPSHCICTFCMDLRTNGCHFPIQL